MAGQRDKADAPQEKDSPPEAEHQPAGGYDATPVPSAPPGYTLRITFHRATNLPMADLNSFSSDPFVLAQLNTSLLSRHKEDPLLRLRTPTVRRKTDPVWDCSWIVANVPASGFKLKARVYDEDPADHDDRLGNVHVTVNHIDETNWRDIKDEPFKIMKRSGSRRAYMIRTLAACVNRTKHLNGDLYISIELLGRTDLKSGESGGRMYTLGPCWWTRHYSPMLGRIANRKEPNEENGEQDGQEKAGGEQGAGAEGKEKDKEKKRKAERYNFQANQMQLQGPVPEKLYHRYVEKVYP